MHSIMQTLQTLFMDYTTKASSALLPSPHFLLGDAPLRPTFPPIFLRHLCIFLLIVASPRWSSLVAPIAEFDGHVT